MIKIKEEDFLKDPLPGRWIKDKDGFVVKAEAEAEAKEIVTLSSSKGEDKKVSADDSKADS